MFRGRMFRGFKLAVTLAFTGLVALATGISCRGFFQADTLSAISLQPPTPQIQVGQSSTIQAWGTYSPDNNRSQIKSGVAWTSSDETVITIDPNTGLATAVTGGTSTITASAQGLSTTGTATAFFGTITNFQVCLGTFGATTSCSTGATPLTWSVASGTSMSLIAQGMATNAQNQQQTYDLTTSSTWNSVTPTPTGGSISCSNSGVSPETCTVDPGTLPLGNYTFTVVYGTNAVATVTVDVTS